MNACAAVVAHCRRFSQTSLAHGLVLWRSSLPVVKGGQQLVMQVVAPLLSNE